MIRTDVPIYNARVVTNHEMTRYSRVFVDFAERIYIIIAFSALTVACFMSELLFDTDNKIEKRITRIYTWINIYNSRWSSCASGALLLFSISMFLYMLYTRFRDHFFFLIIIQGDQITSVIVIIFTNYIIICSRIKYIGYIITVYVKRSSYM